MMVLGAGFTGALAWGFAFSFICFFRSCLSFFVFSFIDFFVVPVIVFVAVAFIVLCLFPCVLGPGPRAKDPGPSWPLNAIRSFGICVLIHYFLRSHSFFCVLIHWFLRSHS